MIRARNTEDHLDKKKRLVTLIDLFTEQDDLLNIQLDG
jgi:hypothetical protein